MKLFIACVAALSLFGCAEDPTSNGGGNLSGVRPAKPSIDDPNNNNLPPSPVIFEGMSSDHSHVSLPDLGANPGTYADTVQVPGHADGVCDNCEVIAIHVPQTGPNAGEEIDMFNTDGTYLCHQFTNGLGTVTLNDCAWLK